MYENDYSWVPSFFGSLSALAAVGGLVNSFIRTDVIRSRVFKAWLLVPLFLSIGLGVIAAVFGENLEPYTPILFVPVFAIIFSPPWLVSALLAYAVGRSIRAKVRRHAVSE